MMKQSVKRNIIPLGYVLIFLVINCGGNQEKSSSSESTAVKPSENGITKLVVNSNDLMQFDTKELRVVGGSKVELTLHHTGKLAKEAMGHNLVILKSGVDLSSFAQRAIKAKDNEYIPEDDDVIAHTALIGGGQSTTVTFDAPARGTYDFLCSFPGHWGLMQGKFIVE